ncbi:hypothetical protein S40293_11609, partial [Stachybotrys chartarum IBT 40293]
DLLIL